MLRPLALAKHSSSVVGDHCRCRDPSFWRVGQVAPRLCAGVVWQRLGKIAALALAGCPLGQDDATIRPRLVGDVIKGGGVIIATRRRTHAVAGYVHQMCRGLNVVRPNDLEQAHGAVKRVAGGMVQDSLCGHGVGWGQS